MLNSVDVDAELEDAFVILDVETIGRCFCHFGFQNHLKMLLPSFFLLFFGFGFMFQCLPSKYFGYSAFASLMLNKTKRKCSNDLFLDIMMIL